jgi:hypothetical protein
MSFSFQWPRFSPQFHTDAIEMLNAALNKGPKPPVIADKIEVVELEMGTQVCVSASASLLVVLIDPLSRDSPQSWRFAISATLLWNNSEGFFV